MKWRGQIRNIQTCLRHNHCLTQNIWKKNIFLPGNKYKLYISNSGKIYYDNTSIIGQDNQERAWIVWKHIFLNFFIIIYRQEFYVWVALGSLDPWGIEKVVGHKLGVFLCCVKEQHSALFLPCYLVWEKCEFECSNLRMF